MMQGLLRSEGGIRLELSQPANPLTIDVGETTEDRIQRLVSENPVVIFSRPSCCMCLVMKSLLTSIGSQPRVIELDEDEIPVLSSTVGGVSVLGDAPVVFIGGAWVGGLENLVALHLSGHLVPKLSKVGTAKGIVV